MKTPRADGWRFAPPKPLTPPQGTLSPFEGERAKERGPPVETRFMVWGKAPLARGRARATRRAIYSLSSFSNLTAAATSISPAPGFTRALVTS